LLPKIRKKFNIAAKDRVDLIADGDLPENFLAELLLLMHVYV
jgi:bifunctional DNA-binding transcriptional regulator/antitoxin component of YhaV-PrlF toxin-antitoxin module